MANLARCIVVRLLGAVVDLHYNQSVGFVWVAIGGALGSCLRYGLSLLFAAAPLVEAFPFATLTANLLGSFGLGVGFVAFEGRSLLGTDLRLFFGTGIMGGFTTYSAFNLESLTMMESGAWGRAAVYMAFTALGCLVAGFFGMFIGRSMRGF